MALEVEMHGVREMHEAQEGGAGAGSSCQGWTPAPPQLRALGKTLASPIPTAATHSLMVKASGWHEGREGQKSWSPSRAKRGTWHMVDAQ